MKPTDEQIKEFWEWCGQVTVRRVRSHEPGSFRDQAYYPTLDLNNLFKYAVPNLEIACVRLMGTINRRFEGFASIDLNKIGQVEHKDPALALFWAIYEVIK